MKIAPLPANEQARLATLRKFDILDTEPEVAFESMVQLAAYICQTPIAAISLIDENRQWFKAIVGLDARETSRDVAFCAHAILQQEPMIVADARADERFHDNPLVTAAPDIGFYAGVPLRTADGFNLGTLCVIDHQARELEEAQLQAIKVVANNIMAHLELRISHQHIRQHVEDLQLAATIFDSSSEAMLVTDAENRIITANPAFTATTGYELQEVVGRNPGFLSSGKQNKAFYQEMWQSLEHHGHWSGEVWNLRKNGELYAEWLSINVIYNDDGSKRVHVALFLDITKRKQADELIWRQANYDHLTKLPNRRLFRDRLEQSIKAAHRKQGSCALLFIDLDHFKAINDQLGHDVGDLLLIEVAKRIKQSLREMDTIARIGGDEFTVVMADVADAAILGRVADHIIQKLTFPFMIAAHQLVISASVGIAVYPLDGVNAEQLLKNADSAMYAAKNAGRNCFRYFDQI